MGWDPPVGVNPIFSGSQKWQVDSCQENTLSPMEIKLEQHMYVFIHKETNLHHSTSKCKPRRMQYQKNGPNPMNTGPNPQEGSPSLPNQYIESYRKWIWATHISLFTNRWLYINSYQQPDRGKCKIIRVLLIQWTQRPTNAPEGKSPSPLHNSIKDKNRELVKQNFCFKFHKTRWVPTECYFKK